MVLRTAKLGESKVIEHFRPRLFKQIDRNQKSLKLDLFWPVPIEKNGDSGKAHVVGDNDSDDDTCSKDAFPFDDLKPLGSFRNLCVLHITGMMISYQPLIWQAVWANRNLTVLRLEMAIPPLFNATSMHPNRVIGPNWSVFPSVTPRPSISSTELSSVAEETSEEPAYLGDNGSGSLNPSFGSGEYLDSVAIKNALVAANDAETLSGQYPRFLGIQELSLMNFVVDGIAFENWFNPCKLKQISFKGSCIDAGFYLHDSMKSVTFQLPGDFDGDTTNVAKSFHASKLASARSNLVPSTSGLKLLTIKNAKVSSRVDVKTGKQEVSPGISPDKQKISPSDKLRGVKNAIKEKLGRGKENKSKDDEQTDGSTTLVDCGGRRGSSSSFVKVSPVTDFGGGGGGGVVGIGGMRGCFGGGFQSLESLFDDAEIKEARDARDSVKEKA